MFGKNINTVLVIDDDFGPRQAIQMILQGKYNVLTCDDPQKAIDVISAGDVDVVMLDIKMPNIDGIELLKAIRSTGAEVEVALITGFPSMQSAVEALQYGAYDYVIKPFDKDKIKDVVRRGIMRRTQKKLEKNFSSLLMSEIFEKFSKNE